MLHLRSAKLRQRLTAGPESRMLFSALLLFLGAGQPADPPETFPAGTVLVVAADNPSAAIQIASGIPGGTVVEFSLLEAFRLAKQGDTVTGVIEINLVTDRAWETGRVVCYAPTGKKRWEERVFFNFGGGPERVAQKFADKLARKTQGKSCK